MFAVGQRVIVPGTKDKAQGVVIGVGVLSGFYMLKWLTSDGETISAYINGDDIARANTPRIGTIDLRTERGDFEANPPLRKIVKVLGPEDVNDAFADLEEKIGGLQRDPVAIARADLKARAAKPARTIQRLKERSRKHKSARIKKTARRTS